MGEGTQVNMEAKRSLSGGQESSCVTVHISFWGRLSLFGLHWRGDKASLSPLPRAEVPLRWEARAAVSDVCVGSGCPDASSWFPCSRELVHPLSHRPSSRFVVYISSYKSLLRYRARFSLYLWFIFAFFCYVLFRHRDKLGVQSLLISASWRSWVIDIRSMFNGCS